MESVVRNDFVSVDGHDTLAKLFRARVAAWGDRVAMREKNFGIWEAFTWADYDRHARQVAGGLMAFQFRFINVDIFNVLLSIEALAMIIVGGLGSVAGAVLGAFFIVLLPEATREALDLMPESASAALSTYIYEIRGLLTGLTIIIMLRVKPQGLVGLWRDIKRYWTQWPLSK